MSGYTKSSHRHSTFSAKAHSNHSGHEKTPSTENRKHISTNGKKHNSTVNSTEPAKPPFVILKKSQPPTHIKNKSTEQINAPPPTNKTIEPTQIPQNSQPHQMAKEQKKDTPETPKKGTKVVVRFLPPYITEEEFLDTLEHKYRSQLNWYRFVPGRIRKSQDKEIQYSTCFMNFNLWEDAEIFRKNYQSQTFKDEYHKIYRITVVFSPFQKVPRKQEIQDRRSNTIEKDPIYQKFIDKLSETKKKPESEMLVNKEISILTNDQGDKVTPLLLSFHDRHGIRTQISGKPYSSSDYQREFNTQSNDYDLPKEEFSGAKRSTRNSHQNKNASKEKEPNKANSKPDKSNFEKTYKFKKTKEEKPKENRKNNKKISKGS